MKSAIHLACAALAGILASTAANKTFPEPPPISEHGTQSAVFAGGCFWGVEGVFEQLKGVSSAVAGYAGGSAATAHYEIVSTGRTGHAESVRVTYDPAQISYGQLLKVFFAVAHDPTEKDHQGPDWGSQYRSAIFYANDDQKREAEAYIAALNEAKVFKHPIVTQVVPLKAFYPAEEHHQHFVERNPTYPYVQYNDLPKISQVRRQFPDMVRPK